MAEIIEIERGDTLTGLSRSHNTTVGHLATTNGISNPDLIYAGDPLVVPSPPAPPSVMSTAPSSMPTPSPHGPANVNTPAPTTAPTTSDAPAQPPAPAVGTPPDIPPEAEEGVQAGEESAEEKEDEDPAEVICNCPDDEEPSDKPAIVRAGGNDEIDVLYAEAGGDAESQGLLGNAEGQVGVGFSRMNHAGNFGDTPVGGSHQLNVATANAQAEGGIVYGAGARGQAQASLVQQSGSLYVGNDGNNPLAEVAGGYQLMAAEAKGNVLLGSDGHRAGLGAGFGLDATAAKADATGEINIPIPFTDWTISARGKAGVNAGSLGVGAQAHVYQNLETERYHAGVGGALSFILGGNLDLDLSIGPDYDDRTRPDGP